MIISLHHRIIKAQRGEELAHVIAKDKKKKNFIKKPNANNSFSDLHHHQCSRGLDILQ